MLKKWKKIIRERYNEQKRYLNLCQLQIRDFTIFGILEASMEVASNVKVLNLWDNNVGANGTKFLAANNYFNLVELYLGQSKIGAEGAKHIAVANFDNLAYMNLWNNNIGGKGLMFLATGNLPKLIGLYLGANNIDAEWSKYLMVGSLHSLREVALYFNSLKQPHLKQVAMLLKEKNLNQIDL